MIFKSMQIGEIVYRRWCFCLFVEATCDSREQVDIIIYCVCSVSPREFLALSWAYSLLLFKRRNKRKKNRHWRDFSGICGCLWLQRKKSVSKYQLLCTLWSFESRLRDPLASFAAEVIVVSRPVSGKLAFWGLARLYCQELLDFTGISVQASNLDSSSKFVKLVAAWRWW
jgi:hypothetical protein